MHGTSFMQNIGNSTVRGAIYIRGAAVNEEKVKGSNTVIMITPPVPRRADWKDDETSIFYIKCESKIQQHEVSCSTESYAIHKDYDLVVCDNYMREMHQEMQGCRREFQGVQGPL